MFKPKMFTIWNTYTKEQFVKDLTAAFIVTVISIPLSVAFSVSQGLSPEIGLYVSIGASLIIALLGGTYVQIGGPSAVFIVTAATVINSHGIQGMMISTFLAGIILIILGLLRMGSMIKFLPYPIMIGFMGGIAMTVFTSQFRNFMGLSATGAPSDFLGRWAFYFRNLHTTNPMTLGVGLLGLLILILWPKINKKIPGTLIALVVTTAIVAIFDLPIATVGSQFTDISLQMPSVQMPAFDISAVFYYLDYAFTIAFLCIVGSLMTAAAADTITGQKHDSNTELIAQGIVNLAMGLFGWLPAAGAPTRTMANVQNGARTPISALLHSIFLLVALVFMLPLLRLIPMVTLAAMLIVAAYGISEWRTFKRMTHAPKGDLLVLIVTFVLTVTVEISVAVIVGLLLSSMIFMRRMSQQMHVNTSEISKNLPAGISVYDVSGPLFFGDTDKFLDAIPVQDKETKVVILRLGAVGSMDSTALRTINILHEKCKQNDKTLILAETTDRPYHAMKKLGMIQQLTRENVCRDFEDAVKVAKKNLNLQSI